LYSRGNPLKYNDPSGHYPAPSGDSGNIICVDFFIQTEKIIFNTGEGDVRGFDPDSVPTQSRAYFYLHLNDQGQLLSVEPHVNPSCTIGGCFSPLDEHNILNVTQDLETGQLHLQWNLTNGVSSQAFKLSEEIYSAEAELGSYAGGSMFANAFGKTIPAINGEMTLSPTMLPGSYDLSYLDREPFPSLEIYQYSNSELHHTIGTLPERGAVGNIGPIWWLNPLAPNELIIR
jgi:hypothetical protein